MPNPSHITTAIPSTMLARAQKTTAPVNMFASTVKASAKQCPNRPKQTFAKQNARKPASTSNQQGSTK